MKIPKKRAGTKPAELFFVEMIIALLFFTLSGAIILRAFAEADRLAKKSAVSDSVVLCAQSAAEVYSVCGDVSRMTEEVFGKEFLTDGNGHCTILLDASCHVSATTSGVVLLLSETKEQNTSGTLSRLTMKFIYSDDGVYTLDCAAYLPAENRGAA